MKHRTTLADPGQMKTGDSSVFGCGLIVAFAALLAVSWWWAPYWLTVPVRPGIWWWSGALLVWLVSWLFLTSREIRRLRDRIRQLDAMEGEDLQRLTYRVWQLQEDLSELRDRDQG